MTEASDRVPTPAVFVGSEPRADGGASDPGANGGADSVALAEARVASALAELDAVDGWPPADQLAAFATTQQALQATLASIDDYSAGASSPAAGFIAGSSSPAGSR